MVWKWQGVAVAVLLTVGTGTCGGPEHEGVTRDARVTAARPPAAPASVCGNDSVLGNGPKSAPAGAVVVPAGDNSGVDFSAANRTFWFAPGAHTLGGGQYDQIVPGDGSRFVGAPGAVLDGRRTNAYAFTGHARGVTIQYLTIRNFGPVGSNSNEGVVNHDSGDDWTIGHNTITANAGAGVMLGSGNVLEYNCLTRNGQYAFNAYSEKGPVGITLDHNEISYNNTDDWEAKVEGCGCTGGGKFWAVDGATVTSNYVHHNHGPGFWADTNNRGFLFEGNYVSDNDDEGLIYETSYNAVIHDNVFLRNALAGGPRNPGFPSGAIYISESGGDRRVQSRYAGAIDISDNTLIDNWSGVVLWENADRYCGSPANTSSGDCTLVDPAVVTARTCNRANIDQAPYYGDCRWKTQHVKVHDNLFQQDRERIGSDCTPERGCGQNGIFSQWGTYPDWSPYQARVVEKAITHRQDNRFYDNTYRGQWRFVAMEQGNLMSFAQWRNAPYGQDAGSTMNAPAPQGRSEPATP